MLPHHLHIFIITPTALFLIIAYPFVLSLARDPPIRVLTHELPAAEAVTPMVSILQVAIVPPVFVHAIDRRMRIITQPLITLNETLQKHFESLGDERGILPRLLCAESAISTGKQQQLNSKAPEILFFSYMYENEDDAALWNEALASVTSGNSSSTPSHLIDPRQIKAARLDTSGSPRYSFWPNAGRFAVCLVLAWLCGPIVLLLKVVGLLGLRFSIGLMAACVIRAALSILSSLALTSFFIPEFNYELMTRFLVVPSVIVSFIAITCVSLYNKLQLAQHNRMTAFRRLSHALKLSFGQAAATYGFAISLFCSALWLNLMLGSNTYLRSLFGFFATALSVDLVLHCSFFLAVVFIDLVRYETLTAMLLEKQSDHYYLPGTLAQKRAPPLTSFVMIFIKNAIRSTSRAVIHLYTRLGATLYIVLSSLALLLALSFDPAALINRAHPNLSRRSKYAEYIDLLFAPTDDMVKYAKIFRVFSPLIVNVNHNLSTSTSGFSSFFTLQYGNILGLVLETFVLLVFVVSTGIILSNKFIGPDRLIFPEHMPKRTFISSVEIPADLNLDIIQLVVDDTCITTLTLFRQITLFLISSVERAVWSSENEALESFTITLPKSAWPVRKMVVDADDGLVFVFHHDCVEIWNCRSGSVVQKYNINSAVVGALSKTFVRERTLIMVTDAGRIIELLPRVSVKTVHLDIPELKSRIAWTIRCSSPKLDYILLLCYTTDKKFVKVRRLTFYEAWSVASLKLSEYIFAHCKRGDLNFRAESSFNILWSDDGIPWTREYANEDEVFVEAVPIPEIQMAVLISSQRAAFVDVNSGVIIRYFILEDYAKGSLKVVHPPPRRCVFCGSPSLDTISMCYMKQNPSRTLMCHIFKIERRSRYQICFRVERDPRETRCLGFDSATELLYSVDGVSSWSPTNDNTVIGVCKRSDSDNSSGSTNSDEGHGYSTTLDQPGLLNYTRHRFASWTSRAEDDDTSEWEAFALTSQGEVFYSSPHFDNERTEDGKQRTLLANNVGPIAPLCESSVCVSFGNTLRILTLEETPM